jgi:hypothetical protein
MFVFVAFVAASRKVFYNPLFGFDGAKVRRFLVPRKHLRSFVRANSPFVDKGQIIGGYLFFYDFSVKRAVVSCLFSTFAADLRVRRCLTCGRRK